MPILKKVKFGAYAGVLLAILLAIADSYGYGDSARELINAGVGGNIPEVVLTLILLLLPVISQFMTSYQVEEPYIAELQNAIEDSFKLEKDEE